MEAIILAGGFGTRLQSVVKQLPKPMAQVANRPFLEYILSDLSRQDSQKFVLCVSYLRDAIIDYFGDSYQNKHISYSIEQTPLGTGGAIKEGLKICSGEYVVVVNGDTFFDVDIKSLIKKHIDTKANITIALKPMSEFERYGSVDIDANGKVIAFREKEYLQYGLINGGIYVVDRDLFTSFDLPQNFSFETFMIENVNNIDIYSQTFDTYFIDIGIPQDYQKANEDFIAKVL